MGPLELYQQVQDFGIFSEGIKIDEIMFILKATIKMFTIFNNLFIVLQFMRFHLLLRNTLIFYHVTLIYPRIKKLVNEACIIFFFTVKLTPLAHIFNRFRFL